MVKVKNKVLIALSVLLCAILFSGIIVFTDNTKSLNAETETQSQNRTTAQDEIKVMATGTDVDFPVNWSLQWAKLYDSNVSTIVDAHSYEQYITSIIFTQSIPDGYEYKGKLDTGLEVYEKIDKNQSLTGALSSDTSDIAYNIAFVNQKGRIVAPENSSILFGDSYNFSVLNDGETLNNCLSLLEVNLKNLTFEAYKVTENGQETVKSVFDTSNVTNMAGMFSADTSGFKNSITISGLEYWDTSKVRNMSGMFAFVASNYDLVVNVSCFDTSSVTIMANMFLSCYKLTSIDVSNFDTSKVTNMSNMFSGCTNVKSLNIGNFDTSKVTDMSYMFSGCKNLTGIIFPSTFDTSKVTTMTFMFQNCTSLKNVDLSSFDVSSVTDMSQMFDGCTNLLSIQFPSNFIANNLESIYAMFKNCESLKSVDLRDFQFSEKFEDATNLFQRCSSLEFVNLSGLDFSNVDTSNIFTMTGMRNDPVKTAGLTKIILPNAVSESGIDLPTAWSTELTEKGANKYCLTTDETKTAVTTIDSDLLASHAGETLELYTESGESLAQPVAPVEPATGVNASVVAIVCSVVAILMIVVTYIVISNNKKKNNKRKVNAININNSKKN